jgi:hypothetical protein
MCLFAVCRILSGRAVSPDAARVPHSFRPGGSPDAAEANIWHGSLIILLRAFQNKIEL